MPCVCHEAFPELCIVMLCLIASFHTLITRNVIQTISNFLLWGSFIVSLRLCYLNQAKFKSQGGFEESQCLLENREVDKKIEAGKGGQMYSHPFLSRIFYDCRQD